MNNKKIRVLVLFFILFYATYFLASVVFPPTYKDLDEGKIDQELLLDNEENHVLDLTKCTFKSSAMLLMTSATSTELASNKRTTNLKSALDLKKKLSDLRASGELVKINQGSQLKHVAGFINSDIHNLNMVYPEDWARLLGDHEVCGVDALFSEHVFEHLTPTQALTAAAAAFPYIKPGGRWRVAVPDAFYNKNSYQTYQRAGHIKVVQPHQLVWSKDTLPAIFQAIGYEVKLCEYFDNEGKFHKEEYDEDTYGKVERTISNDPRNKPGEDPIMTSLVFDAFKPLDCQMSSCYKK